jgi:hypothetical protein
MNKSILIHFMVFFTWIIVAGLSGVRQDCNLVLQYNISSAGEEGSSEAQSDYYYSTVNPVLIDSIVGSSYGVITNVTRFTHNIEFLNDLTIISYNNGQYLFKINQTGDVVEESIQQYYPFEPFHVVYHYNSFNKPDSIYIDVGSDNYPRAYKLGYTFDGKLDYSIESYYINNTVLNYRKCRFFYSQNSLQYSSPIKMVNTQLRTLTIGNPELLAYVDNNFMPDSVKTQYWSNNQWGNSGNYSPYQLSLITGQLIIRYIADRYTYHWVFNDMGLLTNRSQGDSYGSSGASISWFTFTPVEDHIEYPVANLISTYPNPFKSSLSIKFSNKSKTPSDISIYNIKGQLVRRWNKVKSSELNWDGRDNANQPVSSGVYLIKARQGSHSFSAKIIRF